MNNPINRTTIQTASNKYKLYPKSAPCCYKKSDGTYDHIDLTFNDATSTIGDIRLLEKNVVSVGIRKDNNPHKYVGIRPDNNQADGTQQLEFSLINVELDGESQSFNCDTDYEVKVNGSKVKQLVRVNKTFKDFKVEFDIHAKGLPIVNEKYTEEATVRDYSLSLTDLGEKTGSAVMDYYSKISDLDKSIPYIDCYVSKITDDFIVKGQYSNDEEFEGDISSYTIYDMYPNGSAVYLKDSVVLFAKTNTEDCKDIFINNLCSMYVLEDYDDGGSGKYLTKDGKKVMGYISTTNDFWVFINTKEISDVIKALFKRKTFESTSYLDITLDDFKQSIEAKFNLDLQLNVDSDYYQPIDGKFKFKISKEHFYIHQPVLFDESYGYINLKTTHTLKDNGDGSYRYTKYFATEGALLNTVNIKYIDTNLYVSEDESRPTYLIESQKSSANLTTIRNASTGTGNETDQHGVEGVGLGRHDDYMRILTKNHGIKVTNQFGTTYKCAWFQTFYLFDSSGITSEVTSLKLKAYWGYQVEVGSGFSDASMIILKSNTEGGNATSNWNDFVGHTSGWDADDVTQYSGEIVIDNSGDITGGGVQEAALTSDAMTDIENDDTFKFGFIEYDQDYLNSFDSSYGVTASGERSIRTFETDNSNVSYRPYLEVTTEAVAVTDNAVFFGANF